MLAEFPFAIVWILFFTCWSVFRRQHSTGAPPPPDVPTPTGKRIARVRKLLEDGLVVEAAREGTAWIGEVEAGEALFGPAVADCLVSILDARLRGPGSDAPGATSFGDRLLVLLRSRGATGPGPRLRTLLALGHLARGRGEPATAREQYGEALEMATSLPRFGRSDRVFLLLCLASACRECRALDDAALHLERALSIQDAMPGGGHALLDVLALTGWVRLERGELTRAREALERALTVAAETCTEADLVRSGTGECLGRVLLAQGDAAASVAALRRTAEVEERVLGPEHGALVSTFFFLSKALAASGALPDAVAALERARTIQARCIPGHSPVQREIIAALAQLKSEQGDHDVSRNLLVGAIEAEQRAHPEGSAASVQLLRNLAGLERSQGDTSAERHHLERALAIAERVHGRESAELIGILERLGHVVWSSPDWATAREINGRLAQIQRRQLGPDHPALIRTLFNQAIVTARSGEHEEAQRLFADSMDVLSETPFCPPETLGEIVARLEEFQRHPVHGGGYQGLLSRARAIRKDAAGGLPIAQA